MSELNINQPVPKSAAIQVLLFLLNFFILKRNEHLNFAENIKQTSDESEQNQQQDDTVLMHIQILKQTLEWKYGD